MEKRTRKPPSDLTLILSVTDEPGFLTTTALETEGFDEHTPDVETGLKQMRVHYPDITLATPILLAKHLSVSETKKLYPNEVKEILDANKNS